MKSLYIFLFIVLFSVNSYSQNTKTIDTTRRTATIKYNINGNGVLFTPETPPLNQIAGAPKAHYKHFWEFGDGDYSKEEQPTKTYKNEGEYEVRHWATNVYDTGKPPVTKPKKITVNTSNTNANDNASMSSDLELTRNREPIPEEEIIIVLSYKNTKDYVTNGLLYLFYNEQKYKADNFNIEDLRVYHNETKTANNNLVYNFNKDDNATYYASAENKITPIRTHFNDTTKRENLELTLAEAKSKYKKSSILKFENLKPNEERNIFYNLKTTPEMLKDTSAIISVRSVYVPDNNYSTHKVKDMEMEIVTSHDPNKMSTNATFLNYRLVRYKRPKFKIKFQNNGEGPARTIRLETDIPEMFDKKTITVEDMYPKVKICPKYDVKYSCLDTTYTKKQAIFTFKNIYLPGSEQKNVKDYDSTQGFVKYSLKFGKDFHKKKTKSRTAIIFDKNEPIITNYSTTRFLPGTSIGVKTGYNVYSDLKDAESYFIGATISPYKSYRWHWQVELLNSFNSYKSDNILTTERTDINPGGEEFYETSTTTSSYNTVAIEIPVLMRYNVNNYIGLGAGLQGAISLNEKEKQLINTNRYQSINGQNQTLIFSNETTTETSNSFTNYRTGFLIEATAGFSRIGPSLGARYVFNFKENYNYLQLYAIWKF